MALALRVSKLCVLLTGSKLEAARGLGVLKEELTAADARELLLAFLTVSPQLVELTALLKCATNQHEAMLCFEVAMGVENTEGRLYPVVHAALTEHLPTWQIWLTGDRGVKNCLAALSFFTAVNKFSHALLYHRFKVAVKGPWIGPEAAWKKHRERQKAVDKKLRAAGIQYLLSFIECGDGHGMATAVTTPNFLVSLCGTLADDPADVQRQVVLAVAKAMQCNTITRSSRAFAFERKGVASNVLLLVPQYQWAEDAVVERIVPALAVQETRYNLSAKIIPNQVLLHALRHVHPHRFLAHRRVARKILALAPSLALPYLAFLRDSLPVASAGGTLETLAALDVIMMVLEAPLPAAFTCGTVALAAHTVGHSNPHKTGSFLSGAFVLDGTAAAPPLAGKKRPRDDANEKAAVLGLADVVPAAADEGEDAEVAPPAPEGAAANDKDDSFLLTPERVADVVLPLFVGNAFESLLKRGSGLVALHVLQCITLSVRRLRGAAAAVHGIELRAKLFGGGVAASAGFLRNVHRILIARLPAATAVLDAAVGAGFTSVSAEASLHLYERKLLTLRLLQDEVPLYLAGVPLVKVFQPILAAAPAEAREKGTPLESLKGAFGPLSPSAAMLLLQLTMHDAGLKVPSMTLHSVNGDAKGGVVMASPLLEVLVFYHTTRTAAQQQPGAGKRRKKQNGASAAPAATPLADALAALQRACVLVVQALCASTLVAKHHGQVTEAEARAWVEQARTIGDAEFLSDVLGKVYNDVTSSKGAAAAGKVDGASPLLHAALREEQKHGDAFVHAQYLKRVAKAAGVPEAAPVEAAPQKRAAAWGVYNAHVPATSTAAASRDAEGAGSDDASEGQVIDDPAAAVYNVLVQYNGTLSAGDQDMLTGAGGVLACLPLNDFKAGPSIPRHPSRPGPDVLWLQLLAQDLTDRRVQATLHDYPVAPAEVADDPSRVDPRYVTLVLAAHFALCSSREPVTVPEIRRLCLQGLLPLMIRGLSSRDDFVKEHAYTGLAALRQVVPESSPFAMLLDHIRSSAWKPLCRLPNTLAAFFAASAEALFRPGLPTHSAVARYYLRFPYTRRGDLPLADAVVKPTDRGVHVLVWTLQVAQATIKSMATGKCGNSIGALVAAGVLPGCLALLQNPLSPENVRDGALRTIEDAAKLVPTVLLLKQRMLLPLVQAGLTLQPSATGDMRTVVVTKNWDARTRLIRCVSTALASVNNEFDATQVAYDLAASYTAVLAAVMQVGEGVTDLAAAFFPACLHTAHQLALRIETGRLPPRPEGLQPRLVALCKAHRMAAKHSGPGHPGATLDAAGLAAALLGHIEAAEQ